MKIDQYKYRNVKPNAQTYTLHEWMFDNKLN
jgi:hypothetical protein